MLDGIVMKRKNGIGDHSRSWRKELFNLYHKLCLLNLIWAFQGESQLSCQRQKKRTKHWNAKFICRGPSLHPEVGQHEKDGQWSWRKTKLKAKNKWKIRGWHVVLAVWYRQKWNIWKTGLGGSSGVWQLRCLHPNAFEKRMLSVTW